jgi:hypothetical protein
VTVWVIVWLEPKTFVAATTNVETPEPLGVPLMDPVAELRVKPDGSEPDDTA